MTKKKHEGSGLAGDVESRTPSGYCSRSGETDIGNEPILTMQRKGVGRQE